MTGGSQQLRIFRRAIRDGATLEEACAATGNIIEPEEGRIHLARDAKNPPPPECFELLGPTPKETAMAAAAKKDDGEGAGISGEYKRPDAAGAVKIYREEIAGKKEHIATIKGDLSDPYKRIKDQCNFPKTILELLFRLDDMEDAKRDHWLLALHAGLKEMKLEVPTDLVSMAQGDAGGNVVPMGERQRPKLATLQMGVPSDGSETDLADAGEFEASEEELAAQSSRPSTEQAKAEADAAQEQAAPRKARRPSAPVKMAETATH